MTQDTVDKEAALLEFVPPASGGEQPTVSPSTHTLSPSDSTSQNFDPAEIANFLVNGYQPVTDIARTICFDGPPLRNVGGFGKKAVVRLKELGIRAKRLGRFFNNVCESDVRNLVTLVAAEYHSLGPFEEEWFELSDLLEPDTEHPDFISLKTAVRTKVNCFLSPPRAVVGGLAHDGELIVITSGTSEGTANAKTAKIKPKKPDTQTRALRIAGASRSAGRACGLVREKTSLIDPGDTNGARSIQCLETIQISGHKVSVLFELCGDNEDVRLIIFTALLRAAELELLVKADGGNLTGADLKAASESGELPVTDLDHLIEQVRAAVPGFDPDAELTPREKGRK